MSHAKLIWTVVHYPPREITWCELCASLYVGLGLCATFSFARRINSVIRYNFLTALGMVFFVLRRVQILRRNLSFQIVGKKKRIINKQVRYRDTGHGPRGELIGRWLVGECHGTVLKQGHYACAVPLVSRSSLSPSFCHSSNAVGFPLHASPCTPSPSTFPNPRMPFAPVASVAWEPSTGEVLSGTYRA